MSPLFGEISVALRVTSSHGRDADYLSYAVAALVEDVLEVSTEGVNAVGADQLRIGLVLEEKHAEETLVALPVFLATVVEMAGGEVVGYAVGPRGVALEPTSTTLEEQRGVQMDRMLQNYRDLRDAHGWALVGVFSTDAEPGPNFIYTAGLERFNAPELIVYGLPHTAGGTILNDIGDRLRDGLEVADGTVLDDVASMPLVLRTVVDDEVMSVTRHLAGRAAVPALQVVWPDPAGHYPWEPDFNNRMRAAQPMLFEENR